MDQQNNTDTIIIGAGQAGLSTSYFLKKHNIPHVVLEAGKIGNSWMRRWDSFRLNSPHEFNLLPGEPSDHYHPNAFISAPEFAVRLKNYTEAHELPVLENTKVMSLEKSSVENHFIVKTIHNGQPQSWFAKQIVIAAGGENNPFIPTLRQQVPENIVQLHAIDYKNPSLLPEGAVLVIGSATSGVQIAEDLIASGRKVYLSTSAVARLPRRYRGRDIISWMAALHFFDKPTSVAEDFEINMKAPLMSGIGELGHTISLQSIHKQGGILLGYLANVNGNVLSFQNNLIPNIQFGDNFSAQVKGGIDQFIMATGTNAEPPEADNADLPDESLLANDPETQLDLNTQNITSIIWATGFRPDFSWIKLPVLNDNGKAVHSNGITSIEGLYFNGLPWLRNLKSSLIFGAKDDAEAIATSVSNVHYEKFNVPVRDL